MLQPFATATLAFAAGFAVAWRLHSRRVSTNHRILSKAREAKAAPIHDDWIDGPLMPESWYEERRYGKR